ncbi:MAG: tetratricopeptide repeat protein, partial [Pseudomonadales bacterium]|nr:tetratricopeptide repeat protein [Pseudomonadales bacterium]
MTTSIQMLNQGIQFLQQDDLPRAEALFMAILDSNAHDPECLHILGVLRLRQQRLEEALRLLEQAVALDVGNSLFIGNLVSLLITLERYQEAQGFCDRILAADAAYSPVYHHLATLAFCQGDMERAEVLALEAIGKGSSGPQTRFLLAQIFHQQGKWQQAAEAYQHCLSDADNGLQIKLNLADVYARSGNLGAAFECYHVILADFPECADACYGLAVVHQKQGDFDQAIDYYRQAQRFKPDSADISNGIGSLYQSRGELQKALGFFYLALKKDTRHQAALFNQALSLRGLGHLVDAVSSLTTLLDINPLHIQALLCLGLCQQELGDVPAARGHYARVLASEPDNAFALHMSDALDGLSPERAPSQFVSTLFDGYADSYERHLLGTLEFQTPALIAQLLRDAAGHRLPFAEALDLGCGTGLMAQALGPMVAVIDGVDLSPRMLEQAARKVRYRQLNCLDIETCCTRQDLLYDCCLASDVLIYTGDLTKVFAGVNAVLKPGGLFVFSTESDRNGDQYRLCESGRYAHANAYIQRLSQMHGFSLEASSEVSLR